MGTCRTWQFQELTQKSGLIWITLANEQTSEPQTHKISFLKWALSLQSSWILCWQVVTKNKQSKEMNLGQLIGSQMDALALSGHTQYELSMKWRDAIIPSLNKDYTGLCSQNVPVTSLLFGDDLQQQVNTMKASNKFTQASASGLNRREVLIKVPLMIIGSQSLQISTTGVHILSKPTGKIGERSQKTWGPPSTRKRRGARTEYKQQWPY